MLCYIICGVERMRNIIYLFMNHLHGALNACTVRQAKEAITAFENKQALVLAPDDVPTENGSSMRFQVVITYNYSNSIRRCVNEEAAWR